MLALAGVVLRFWLGWVKLGFDVALAGVVVLLAARAVAVWARFR